MTIPDERPQITGSETLREAATEWAARFGAADGAGDVPLTEQR